MDERRYKVSGVVTVDIDEVIVYLLEQGSIESGMSANCEITDDDYINCARYLFERGSITWEESDFTEIKE